MTPNERPPKSYLGRVGAGFAILGITVFVWGVMLAVYGVGLILSLVSAMGGGGGAD